jgi:hypothetical protein
MIAWNDRPESVRNLFNPVFCAALLSRAVRGYNDSGMDLSLAYVVLPLVLHAEVRSSLPRTVATSLPAWRERNPDLIAWFGQLAVSMKPFTDAAIVYATSATLLRYDSPLSRLQARINDTDVEHAFDDDRFAEVSGCLERSRFVGRWLARSGSTSLVFSMLGIRP